MNTHQRTTSLIHELDLEPHPEGGYFKRQYYSEEYVLKDSLPERYSHLRHFYSSIYYLLGPGDFSAFHRLKSDEIWHFFEGDSISIHFLNPDGTYSLHHMGINLAKGECYQLLIPHGTWFAAQPVNVTGYTLIGCTVIPAFDYEDFEIGDFNDLSTLYPQHTVLVRRFCRG
jgi:predicted cupin superfamily sugar epimerase